MATQAQIESQERLEGSYSLITGAASITDVTNWASIGITSPDTVKILLWIVDPSQTTFYKNAGYDTADFTNPDLEPLNGTATYSYTLPTDITGAYISGQYTVNMKIQVDESGTYTNASVVRYQNVLASCIGVVPSVEANVTYNTAIVSVTDNTNYGSYTGLSATLTLYPPPQSGQASQTYTSTGSPTTLIYEPPTGQYPWTGVWTWTLVTNKTYTDPTTLASTTCQIRAEGTFNVVQSQLCKVYCALKKYRGEVQVMAANRQTYTELAEKNLVKAEGEYILAWAASYCGKPQSEIDIYINSIYSLINKTPDCDCGCGDGTSQPLVPTSIINGTDGDDGSVILNGSGIPAGNLGSVGDYYIDVDTGNWYTKTGATTWTFLVNLTGATGSTGATGPAGAAGADGVAVLNNTFPNASTAGTSFETLGSYSLLANTLADTEDEITIHSVFTTNDTDPDPSQLVRVTFNGSALNTPLNIGFYAKNIYKIIIDVRLGRTSNTTAKYELTVSYFSGGVGGDNLVNQYKQAITSLAGLNFTTTAYTIAAQGNSDVAGDITLEAFEIIYYKKQ